MAGEIQVDYPSGEVLYAVIRDGQGRVWNVQQGLFEDWGAEGYGVDAYSITLVDKGGGRYVGDFAQGIEAGRYFVQVFCQLGSSIGQDDVLVGSGVIVWSGVGELTAEKMLINKAVQDKATGAIDYYDDDGVQVLLRHRAVDDTSNLSRVPEQPS